MNTGQLLIKREEIYDKVWSKPMIHLCKEYGLSDNGLRKICRKLNVPLPAPGYWQKLQYGKAIKQPSLPEFDGVKEVIIYKKTEIPIIDKEFHSKIQLMIAQEQLPENQVKVSKTLEKPHPWVVKAKKAMQPDDPYRYEKCLTSRRESLDIFVSPANLNRALCIMDALIKALETRKHKVFINTDKNTTSVDILGQVLDITLRENLKCTITEDRFGPKNSLIPNGDLVLRIRNDLGYYRTRWTDGKEQKLEDKINSFIEGLYKAVLWEREFDLKREREHREWEEKRRKQEETRKLKEQEQAKLNNLKKNAADWHQSRTLRAYIKAATNTYIANSGKIEPGSDFEKWQTWANQQADRLDPLVESQPSILDHKIDEDLY